MGEGIGRRYAQLQSRHDIVDLVRQGLELALAEADDRTLAARVSLEGATAVHAAMAENPDAYANEIRLAATDLGQGNVFVEKIVFATRTTLDLASIRAQNDAIGQLARTLHSMKDDRDALLSLVPELSYLKQKLPLALSEGPDALALDERHLQSLVGEVEEMLLARLLANDGGR